MRPFAFMNKKELIAIVKEDTQLSQQEVTSIVKEILENITNALGRDEKIDMRGFGVFSMRLRKARKGRNLRTGEEIKIPACKVINFRLSRLLKQEIKNKR